MNRALVICGAVIATVIAGLASVNAQTTATQTAAPVAEGTANKTPPFKKEELEAILVSAGDRRGGEMVQGAPGRQR